MADLTDAEIIAACARAVGRRYWNHQWLPGTIETSDDGTGRCAYIYNPLTDRAQAMELVDRFRLNIEALEVNSWYVENYEATKMHGHEMNGIYIDDSRF